MADEDGLVCAFIQPGGGKWQPVDWPDVTAWKPETGLLWIHTDRAFDRVKTFLAADSGLDALVVDGLLAEETRPRTVAIDDHLLVILRGVNLNPGADPEDMVSIRLWIGPDRIISTRHRRLMAVNDIRERIEQGHGPTTPGDFLVELTGRLVERMSPVIEALDEACDELEDQVVTGARETLRAKLSEIRRQAIGLRRYLAPQREAMNRMIAEEMTWLSHRHKARLRETSDRITRYVEDLDAIRERAAVIQDEIMNRVSEQMNRTMYILTLVATVVMPLSFVTGLLGINVDGIPGSEKTPWAFAAVIGGLGVLTLVEIWLLRRLKWL